MIKAIVTDVDGVIVGKKPGVNFPLPNAVVTQQLKDLHTQGIPVVLNTAKFNRAVLDIITKSELRNPHITDGGALIIDPIAEKVIKKHVLGKLLAREIVKVCLEHGFYTEFYGSDEGFLQRNQTGDFYKKRVAILQQELTLVDSLLHHVDDNDVIKIMPFYHKPEERKIIEQIMEPYKHQIHLVFSHHPSTYPTENAIITIKGVSKKAATIEVLDYLDIRPEEALGVGDTLGDWQFMEVCGFVAVTGSHSKELKEKAHSKGEGKFFLADDADHDGFLQVVDYFFS